MKELRVFRRRPLPGDLVLVSGPRAVGWQEGKVGLSFVFDYKTKSSLLSTDMRYEGWERLRKMLQHLP